MKSDKRTAYVTRDNLLKLLSDDEVASVSSAETEDPLADGEVYLDLDHLDKGVCRAKGDAPPMGRVLPKRAVHATTWNKIMAQLAPAPAAEAPSRP